MHLSLSVYPQMLSYPALPVSVDSPPLENSCTSVTDLFHCSTRVLTSFKGPNLLLEALSLALQLCLHLLGRPELSVEFVLQLVPPDHLLFESGDLVFSPRQLLLHLTAPLGQLHTQVQLVFVLGHQLLDPLLLETVVCQRSVMLRLLHIVHWS